MRSKAFAILAAVTALSCAAAPVAAASTHHHSSPARTDQSRDARGVQHVDRSSDSRSDDGSADMFDR